MFRNNSSIFSPRRAGSLSRRETRFPAARPLSRARNQFFLLGVLTGLFLALVPAWSRSPEAGAHGVEFTDLALGKPARATSTGFWRHAPSNVTDGNPETGWRPLSHDPFPLYVEVDLQGVHSVGRVGLSEILGGGAYRLTGYEVHTSTDGLLWQEAGAGGTIGRGIVVDFDLRPARFIRLVITGNDGLGTPMIGRLAAFGPTPDPGAVPPAVERPPSVRAGDTFRTFGLLQPSVEGEIVRAEWPERRKVPVGDGWHRFVEEYERTIHLVVPAETDVASLVPVFTTTGGRVVAGDGISPRSGVSRLDFRQPVSLLVVSTDGTETPHQVIVHRNPADALVTVYPERIGRGPRFVGYSAMNITEGDNLAKWHAYSRVNGVRYWLTPGRQVGMENVTADHGVKDADAFDARRDDLRRRMLLDPRDSTWINWDGVDSRNRELVQEGGRRTAHHALSELRRMGIEIMAELNDSQWAEPFASPGEKWQRAWVLWQLFYAQSFYLAANFDVWKFQGPNEPEHHLGQYSGSPEERAAAVGRFVFMNAVYADAMRSAVADVNHLYGKKLKPIWGAPTLASQPTSDVSLATLRANRTNHRGDPVDFDITDLFIMQRYSGNPETFVRANREARDAMESELPGGGELPIAYTEFNFMPGSVWRNQDFTSDAPHVFRAMARVWAGTMMDGVFGMYQFRIARPINFGGNHVHHMFQTFRDPARNLLYGRPYRVSSEAPGNPLSHVLLNTSGSPFAWKTAEGSPAPHEAVWDLEEQREIRWFVLGLGTREEGLREASLQFLDERRGEWRAFPGGTVRDGSVGHYLGVSRTMPGLNRRTPIDNVPSIMVSRALSEPVRARHIRFVSDDPGPITVRRIFLSEQAAGGDIGGPMKSAEVTRLFAEAFAGAPPLHRTEATATHDPDYAASTAFCEKSGRYAVWVPQTSDRVDYQTTVDFSRLPGVSRGLFTVREVSQGSFGDVIYRGRLPDSGRVTLKQPKTSLWLAGLQPGLAAEPLVLEPVANAQIALGDNRERIFGSLAEMAVRQHTADPSHSRAVYFKFDLSRLNANDAGAAFFQARGRWASVDPSASLPEGETFTLHLYGIEETGWDEENLTGVKAPNFGRADSLVGGPGARPLAVISFGAEDAWRTADVSQWIKERVGREVAMVLVRERRHENEINDTDGVLIASRWADPSLRPRLEIWAADGND